MRNKKGLDALDVLQITFIVLKLVGVIHWSWWWVLSPIWIMIVVIFFAKLVAHFIRGY